MLYLYLRSCKRGVLKLGGKGVEFVAQVSSCSAERSSTYRGRYP